MAIWKSALGKLRKQRSKEQEVKPLDRGRGFHQADRDALHYEDKLW